MLSNYDRYNYPPWSKRLILRTRRRTRRQRPTKLDNLIFLTCYSPGLIKLARRSKKIKFKTFKGLPYLERRRLLRLFIFLQTHKPQKVIRKRKKIYSTYKFTPHIQHRLTYEPLSFDSFSYRFVKGGLLSQRQPLTHRPMSIGRPYYEGGTPDVEFYHQQQKKKIIKTRRRQRLKVKRTKIYKIFLEYQSKNRHRYYPQLGWHTSFKIKKDKPYLHSRRQPPETSRVGRLWRVVRVGQRSRWWWSNDVKHHLDRTGRQILSYWGRFQKKKEIVPLVDGPQIKYHRRHPREQFNRQKYQQFLSHRYLYRGRWRWQFQPVRQIDPVQTRWTWSTKHKGSFLGGRQLVVDPSHHHRLRYRLVVLQKKLFMLRRLRYNVGRLWRHRQCVVDLPRAKRLRLSRRRYHQRRLLRLRRVVELVPTVDSYYQLGTQHTYTYYKFNRFQAMEFNNTLRPAESVFRFVGREQTYREDIGNRFFFSYYYNYFIKTSHIIRLKGWRRDRQRRKRTKSGELRMKTIKEHPVWGKHLKDEQQRRFKFLRDNLITKLARKFNFKNYKKVPHTTITASVYIHKVDTRRKLDGPDPVDRSLMSFFLAFIEGLGVEKHQKKTFPATLGALLSFNRSTLNLETFFAPRRESQRPRVVPPPPVEPRRLPPVVVPGRPGWHRWLMYWGWFYLFTPVWWVYYGVARGWCGLFRVVRHGGENFWDSFRGWLYFYWRLLRLCFVSPLGWLTTRIQGLRVVRLGVWVYTAWLHVDLLENDQTYTDRSTYDEGDNLDLEADAELDPDGDRAENDPEQNFELGYEYNEAQTISLGTVFYYGNPTWEWYLQNVPDEEIEELFDEASYFTRLFTRPVVDFIVRLPFWSLLELCSLWLEVAKGEYHRLWYKILTFQNRPGQVRGRWWKVPLVLVKLSVRLSLWGLCLGWLLAVLTAEDLKILCTYNFGLPWFEEYYYGYVAGCFLISVYLVGPIAWRDFCFKELGFEGLLYVFVAPASVSRPEAYQPQRPTHEISKFLTRWDLNYGEKEWSIYHDYLSGRFENQVNPNGIFSYDDIRIVLAQFNEFDQPLGSSQLDWFYVQNLQDRPIPGEKSVYRFSEGHPSELKNEWDRRNPYDWHPLFTLGSVLPNEDKQYRSSTSGDQYWNRTIVNRMEYPQNLRQSLADRRR